MTRYTEASSASGADGPFFRIIRQGLHALADGEDYFDLLSDDVVFEYVSSVPGYPRRFEGRQNIIDLYRGYDDYMAMQSADNLAIYRDAAASVAILEYQVRGESIQTGRPFHNRVVSINTVINTRSPIGETTLTRSLSSTPQAGAIMRRGRADTRGFGVHTERVIV